MAAVATLILLAEDNSGLRKLIAMRLKMRGCRVIEAVNGKEAIELAPKIRPKLIFMDLRMPVMTGWEATRHLRKMPATQTTPIIGLSADCEGDGYKLAIAVGCNDCIQKPIDDETLDRILREHLA